MKDREVQMADAATLSLAFAVPNLVGVHAIQASLSRFCLAHELFASVALSCIDVANSEERADELSAVMEATLRRADSARSFGDATIGIGVVIGEMSIGQETMFSARQKRKLFQVAITMLASRKGVITWDIQTPEELRYLTPKISEHGVPILQGIVGRRGHDQHPHMLQVASGIMDNLVKSPQVLHELGMASVH